MKYFEDFQVGNKIVTRGRTVTETDLVNFASFTGDWYPLHTDSEYARKTRFGERIAHGMLTLSLATGLWSPEYTMQWAFVAFYGIDGVRFTAPVKIGDTLRVEFEVIEKQDTDDHNGIVNFEQSVKNQRGEVVLVAMFKLVIAKQ
ncbi:MAG: MaoC family dehydratase N-terminal domain-containing protein [Dehalococcoidia bacterium]|nr:MaoC family dehydratase N-terminal domain-containing protein [Dehalococcoidia bacterium]